MKFVQGKKGGERRERKEKGLKVLSFFPERGKKRKEEEEEIFQPKLLWERRGEEKG